MKQDTLESRSASTNAARALGDPTDAPSAKQILDREGAVLLKGALPKETLGELRTTLLAMFAAHAKDGEDIFSTSVRLDQEDKGLLFRIYQFLPQTAAMDAVRRACLKYVRMLHPQGFVVDVGSGVLFGLPRDKRLVWTWHQETHYHPTVERIVHFWFPILESSSPQNGTMSALRGTHKLGPLPFQASKPASNGGTSLIPVDIEKFEREFDEIHFLAEPGDLALIDKHLIHRSNFNHSNHTRFTGVVRLAVFDQVPPSHNLAADFSTLKPNSG